MSHSFASVAIIIVNWNAGLLLKKCLTTIDNQTIKPRRIIVVDNASSDGSADGIEEAFPMVEVVRMTKNIGFAAANNHAAKMAGDCDWIALLNPDAFAKPEWLENLLKATKAHKEYSFFASRMLNASNPHILDGIGDVYHVSGLVWRRGFGVVADEYNLDSTEVFSPCAAAAMYRRKDFMGVGGFDESYFCYLEDVDLGFRLRLAGHRCMYVATAIVLHEGSGTTSVRSDFSTYHGHRNLVWTYAKNMPWLLFWVYLPQFFFLNIASLFVMSLRGQGGVIFKAKWSALKGLPRVLKERRISQRERKASLLDLLNVMEKGLLAPYFRRE